MSLSLRNAELLNRMAQQQRIPPQTGPVVTKSD